MIAKINLYFLFEVVIFSCFAIVLLLYLDIPTAPDQTYQWLMISLTLISTVCYILKQRIKYSHIQWLSIGMIFIFGYIIVFYQLILLDLIGFQVPRRYYSYIWARDSVINKSISLSTLGLLAFYLGQTSLTTNISSRMIYIKENNISTKSIFLILPLAYFFYILFFLSSGSYMYGDYSADDASGVSTYFFKLFEINLSAAVIIKLSYITSLKNQKLTFKRYLNSFEKPLLALLFWHMFFSLFVGDRDTIIYYSILVFGLYFLRWKRLKLLYLAVGIFLLSVFFTLIGEVRQSRYSGVGYTNRISDAFFSTQNESDKTSKKFDTYVPGDSTIELALSVRTLNHAIYNVPDKYDLMYGLYQLKHLYSVFPGISTVMNKLLFDGEKKYDGSSNFITFLIQGDHPMSGDGTSVVADLYLDFDIFGVIAGLFLFGLFINKNEYKLYSGYHRPSLLWIATLIFLLKHYI